MVSLSPGAVRPHHLTPSDATAAEADISTVWYRGSLVYRPKIDLFIREISTVCFLSDFCISV